MEQSRFSKLFYLAHTSGDKLYPVQMENRDTGRVSFRVSAVGEGGNTKDKSKEILDEKEMKSYVFDHEYSVRAATLNGSRKGLYKINQRSIVKAVELA